MKKFTDRKEGIEKCFISTMSRNHHWLLVTEPFKTMFKTSSSFAKMQQLMMVCQEQFRHPSHQTRLQLWSIKFEVQPKKMLKWQEHLQVLNLDQCYITKKEHQPTDHQGWFTSSFKERDRSFLLPVVLQFLEKVLSYVSKGANILKQN